MTSSAALQVGSIYEYANRNPVFGVVKPDNFLWAPILLFFAVTGFPSAGKVYSVHKHSPEPKCCLLIVGCATSKAPTLCTGTCCGAFQTYCAQSQGKLVSDVLLTRADVRAAAFWHDPSGMNPSDAAHSFRLLCFVSFFLQGSAFSAVLLLALWSGGGL